MSGHQDARVPEETKFLPAVRLAKRGKGVPRNFSRAERQKRRERIIEMNKRRSKQRKEKPMPETETPPTPQPEPPPPPTL